MQIALVGFWYNDDYQRYGNDCFRNIQQNSIIYTCWHEHSLDAI